MSVEREREHTYIAIDLKSFYASVECVERGLEPLTTNLVVADPDRTEKTICLAVSPGLKSYGLPGRPRLFEVVQAVKRINANRRRSAPGHVLSGKSYDTAELASEPSLELDYIVAPPRMALYMKYSTDIYNTYLKYVSPDDILVYSCDEVFMDVTEYLKLYGMTPHELAITMIKEVLAGTGITATAGIGTNLFLSKVAMDIVAKKMPADEDGVRIAELDEMKFRRELWEHKPITDFWGFGSGTAKRLSKLSLFTLGDVAKYSEICEDNLYRTFGIKAELIIDHAWGWEPCTMRDIKEYKPGSSSLSSGQVLQRPYSYEEAEVIVREMTDLLTLELADKELVTDQMTLTVCYECFRDPDSIDAYKGTLSYDWYGRPVAKNAHGTANLKEATASTRIITEAVLGIYERTVDKELYVRRVYVCAARTCPAKDKGAQENYEQMDLFTDYEERERKRKAEEKSLEKERALQRATVDIKQKYGNNAILKGTNFKEGAMGRERNRQIGGHKA